MTDDEIRFAIAEWRGWKWYRLPSSTQGRYYRALFHPAIFEKDGQPPRGFGAADMTERVSNIGYMETQGMLPAIDYPSVQHAISLLDEKKNLLEEDQGFESQRDRFVWWLEMLVSETCAEDDIYWNTINAPPQLRAQALLRAIGTWNDDDYDIWQSKAVLEAMSEGRAAHEIAVLECPACGKRGYYNEGSSFYCYLCRQQYVCLSEDDEATGAPYIRLDEHVTLADLEEKEDAP